MWLNILYIILGFVLLMKGGDFLIDGAVAIAQRAKLSAMVIGITVVGFGTSMPELLVSTQAAWIGSSGLAIGNVLAIVFCLLQQHFKFIRLNPENYFISYVPIDISWWSIVAADVLCFAAIMAILLIPCHFISRIQPSKTIRVR